MHKSVKNGQLKKTPPYGRIKETTIRGIFMSRGYRNIKQYEKEILQLKEQGLTKKEIGKKFGLTFEQVHNFITRYNQNQRKIAAGITPKKKGRPAKDCTIREEDTLADLRYKMARKDAKIKQLEMENELMRDFILLTGRK